MKKFIYLLAIILLFGTPLAAMFEEEFENASIPRIVTQNHEDLSGWYLVPVAKPENCLSDWYLVPVVKAEPYRARGMDIFDVFSSDEKTPHSLRKTHGDKIIPMESLGINPQNK
ncbi:MAG: hypothetical protein H0X26_06305 [Alphaproteobacteria bacterium]|nr:hypothetical protein [Alphaproteobacteria bacterium]